MIVITLTASLRSTRQSTINLIFHCETAKQRTPTLISLHNPDEINT